MSQKPEKAVAEEEEDALTLVFEIDEDSHSDEESGSDIYNAFTYIKAKIFKKQKDSAATSNNKEEQQIGEISGISIDRQRIATDCYHEAFDVYGSELEWVGCLLMENRYGRITLQSLYDAGDDTSESNFLLISDFKIDDNDSFEDKDTTSNQDVATSALRKFLFSKEIKGNLNHGCWIHSSVAFVLSSIPEKNDHNTSRKKRMRDNDDNDNANNNNDTKQETEKYKELIPFLRNGFFQDAALVHKDIDNARILVGGISHFEKPTRSASDALGIAKTLLGAGYNPRNMFGVDDAAILNRVKIYVNANNMKGIAYAMMDFSTEEELIELKRDLTSLSKKGGSISTSTALHTACENNLYKVAKLLLDMDANAVNARNDIGQTPLIVASINAKGRCSINGIDETDVIDILLKYGADKCRTDADGMTAYAHFQQNLDLRVSMTHYHSKEKLLDLAKKLAPADTNTLRSQVLARTVPSGFVDYTIEDDEADRAMGRGRYADSEEEEEAYGDY